MRKRLALVTAIVAVLGAIGASSASAAVEFGDNCSADGNGPETETPLFEISNAANPLSTAAPISGVITKWKVNVGPTPGSAPFKFIALRPSGTASATIVGSQTGTVAGGPNAYGARIPVQAGDRIALQRLDSDTTVLCKSPAPKSVLGLMAGDTEPGSFVITAPVPEQAYRVPLAAVVEPDADNDGYGDETQDKCPQNASAQGSCPLITVDALSVKGKGSVTVLVGVNEPAPVSVTGTVKLGKGRTAKLKAPTKSLTPGPIGKFKLKFTSALKSRLKELDRGQSLQLKVSAQATNASGAPSSDNLKLKLKG